MISLSKLSTPLFIAGGAAAIAYAGTCLALYNYQTRLIFRPLSFLVRNPAAVGLAYEDIWIPLTQHHSQTVKLHGWWIPNPGSNRTLLLCHGNYGNVSYNVDRCHFYHSLGFSVLSFDYRGYGLSPSAPPSEQKAYEDAEAALHYLLANRQIAPSAITVLGHSLGGAIAINLATQHPELNSLIVECSFTSMKDAVHAKKIYQFFPVEQLLDHAFDSLSKVKNLKLPVLYVHGDQDLDIPSGFSQQLFEASPAQKQLWIVPGAGHNNITTDFRADYKKIATAFLAQLDTVEKQSETEQSEVKQSEAQNLSNTASHLSSSPDLLSQVLSQDLVREIRSQRKFTIAEAIGREGGNFMKGESAIPRPLRATTEINQFVITHFPNPSGPVSATLQSWAKEDIRVSRYLDTPLIALSLILESLLNEPSTFQEFFRQIAIAQSKLTGDRPHFQRPNHPPHPDAAHSHDAVKQQLSNLLQKLQADSK